MSKGLISLIAIGSIVGLLLIVFLPAFIGGYNNAIDFKVSIEAKIKDNKSEFNNMKVKITQVAQVSTAQMDKLANIFNDYAKSRTGGGSDDKLLMKWISESIPNVDTTTFNNLQNIIVSSRDSWTMRQKELIDLQREYRRLLQRFPTNIILSIMGFKDIEIPVITSTYTEKTFETQKDDDNSVFEKKEK